MASRSCSSFSFCLRVNGSSLRSRWFRPNRAAGEPVIAFLDFEIFGERLMAFVEILTAFFEADLLADTLRLGLNALSAGRPLRAVDFFAELFFFFGLAIA